jgi:hypothetical protein
MVAVLEFMDKVLVGIEVQFPDILVKAVLEPPIQSTAQVQAAEFLAVAGAGPQFQVVMVLMQETMGGKALLELFGVQTDRSHQQIQESYNGSLYTH